MSSPTPSCCSASHRYHRGQRRHLHGFQVDPGFDSELTSLFTAAKAANLWGASHYAMTNYEEYFAEGVLYLIGIIINSFYRCRATSTVTRRPPPPPAPPSWRPGTPPYTPSCSGS